MLEDHNENMSRILFVEDDENIAKLFLYSLQKAGYNCKHAIDGQEGFDFVKQFKPDLIISDVMMPKMDGFELCGKLKTDQRTSHIPVILLTAKAESSDKIEGYEFVSKSSSPGA